MVLHTSAPLHITYFFWSSPRHPLHYLPLIHSRNIFCPKSAFLPFAFHPPYPSIPSTFHLPRFLPQLVTLRSRQEVGARQIGAGGRTREEALLSAMMGRDSAETVYQDWPCPPNTFARVNVTRRNPLRSGGEGSRTASYCDMPRLCGCARRPSIDANACGMRMTCDNLEAG